MNYTLARIQEAAARRGIAWRWPAGQANDEFIVLEKDGRAVTVQKTRTPYVSAVALRLSCDKFLSARTLAAAGVPTAPQLLTERCGPEAAAFLRAQRRLAVKPNRGDRGLGVTLDVADEAGLAAAVAAARRAAAGPVLIEKQMLGRDYRLLVIGGEFVACYERLAPSALGDGRRSVRQLLDAHNAERAPGRAPLRGREVRGALARQDLTLESVPARDRRVRFAFHANLHQGARAVDRTDDVHPEMRRLAVRAAAALAIDVAGVDVICPDIAAPGGAVVLEVNSMPGVRGFLQPDAGRARPVVDRYLEYLFGRSDGK